MPIISVLEILDFYLEDLWVMTPRHIPDGTIQIFPQGQPRCPACRSFVKKKKKKKKCGLGCRVNKHVCIYGKENMSIKNFIYPHINKSAYQLGYADSQRMVGWNPGEPSYSFSNRHSYDSSRSNLENVTQVTKHKDGSNRNCVLCKKNSED